ncbi:MAG: chromosome segregation protein SMC [Anaerolineales bacterium]
MTPRYSKHSRLTSLELQGYKTFAPKTSFAFAPTITAVVGPNGSGKSNIADAIRWVLGEQSYSLLRGKKTEDMIFNGSEARPRASMAAATITFDNADGWLPIDFSEVTVGRRAYRDGQNEYLINGQKVRLRDISEMLAESGLAQRTYTVIGQGLVDAALSLRAEERRQLFEEAAGIGLYRGRREEAVRRLENTRRNLERVQDILAELRPRLRSLERQSQRARDYEQVKEDLKDSLRIWYGFHWDRMQRVVGKARDSALEHAAARQALHRKQDEVDEKLAATRATIAELRQKLQSWTGEASELYSRREQLGRQLAVLTERIGWLDEQRELMQSELESLEQERSTLAKAVEVSRDELAARQAEVEALEGEAGADGGATLRDQRQFDQEIGEIRRGLEALAARRAAWTTRQEQLSERRQQLQDSLRAVRSVREAAERASADARADAEQAAKAAEEAAGRVHELDLQLEALGKQSGELLKQRDQTQKAASSDQERLARLQAKLTAMVEMAEGTLAGSRALLEAGERGELAGIAGRLASQLKVPTKYRRALLTALGERIAGLAVEDARSLEAALGFLEAGQAAGRTVLIPRSPLRGSARLEPPDDDGVLGNAADLIDGMPAAAALTERLLGHTWVVSDRSTAIRLRQGLDTDAALVTQAGELFLSDGTVIVGQPILGPDRQDHEALETELASVENDLDEERAKLTDLENTIKDLQSEIETGEVELSAARDSLRQAEDQRRQAELESGEQQARLEAPVAREVELEAELAKVADQRAALSSEGEAFEEERGRLERSLSRVEREAELGPVASDADLRARWESARMAQQEAAARLTDRQRRLQALTDEVDSWQGRLADSQRERAAKAAELTAAQEQSEEIESALAERRADLDPAEVTLKGAEEQRAELEKAESQLRFELQAAENRHSEAQVELARREEELLGLKRRIEDDFGLVAYEYDEGMTGQETLPLEGLVERLPSIEELPADLETQVKRLRAQLRRMGSINPEAQQEFEEVKQRVDFMTTQVDDLRKAESQIQEVIVELDVIMAREFRKTFDEVAVAFKETFSQLFGGGAARLELTNPDDPNESGIEIEARLPGKREQGLAVLSGGERSLTACALVFALLKVSPTPFCVLDEVDAMLDEANVGRFCEQLEALSENTQFIVITHNRQTVQVAQAVYGISMRPDSTSKVISLDLDEAAREAAA